MISIASSSSLRILQSLLARLKLAIGGNNLYQIKRSLTSLILVVLFILTTLAVSARSWFPKMAMAGKRKDNTNVAWNQTTKAKPVQVELFTVRRYGFEPAQITRPKGRFIIAVDNRSGVEEIVLQLHRVVGSEKQEK